MTPAFRDEKGPAASSLAGADADKDQDIRRVLYRLSKVAERQHCTTVAMRHLNKTSSGKAIYRGNMSIGVTGHARIGLSDPDGKTFGDWPVNVAICTTGKGDRAAR